MSCRMEAFYAIKLPVSGQSGVGPLVIRIYEYCLWRSGRTTRMRAGSVARIISTDGKANIKEDQDMLHAYAVWDSNPRLLRLREHSFWLF